jgi:hypothetical protein
MNHALIRRAILNLYRMSARKEATKEMWRIPDRLSVFVMI